LRPGNLIYHKAVHSSRELRSSSFEIRVDGRAGRVEDLFEGFGEEDRLGVVMSGPCGAVGASALITATITAFYDIQRARGDDFFVYPDYYLFHVGRPLGDHARLDVWPRRKEVVVGERPQEILEAIDDRAITRLVVEDGEPAEAELDPEAVASARVRIETCLAYSPAGRVAGSDVRIAGNDVTEGYVEAILDPEGRIARLRAQAGARGAREATGDPGAREATGARGAREATGDRGAGAEAAARSNALRARIAAIEARIGEVEPAVRRLILRGRAGLLEDGVPVETYRRIGLDEALGLLGASAPREAG
jgi:hypothetical protein